MPRDITITFSDGTKHQYNNTPDSVTPDDIEKRAKKDYPNKKISNISGGKKKPAGDPLSADPISANARPKGSAEPVKVEVEPVKAKPEPKSDELNQVKKNAGLDTKAELDKPKDTETIYQDDKWRAKVSKDAMTDELSCTLFYKPNPKYVQIGLDKNGGGTLYIGYGGRGGIKGYQYRLDSEPATQHQLPTRMEKEVSSAMIPLSILQGRSKFAIQTLTVLNTVETDTVDLTSLKSAINACQLATK